MLGGRCEQIECAEANTANVQELPADAQKSSGPCQRHRWTFISFQSAFSKFDYIFSTIDTDTELQSSPS